MVNLSSIHSTAPRVSTRKSGSVLITVVILMTVLGIMVASLLKLGGTEMRLNKSQQLYIEASNAAESMAEYGFAQLQSRWRGQTAFSLNELRNAPLQIPDSTSSFYAGTDVVYNDLELIGGNVPPGEWKFIDPSDPANQSDPQRGKLVFQREVEVYGKGLVESETLGEKAAYCVQTLSVRDAPLFSHAIFYNMDLEFHPGPRMDMTGPVHANGDIFSIGSSGLYFHSTVMSAKGFFHGYKQSGTHKRSGPVRIKDASGNWKDIYLGSGGREDDASYVDSNMGDAFRAAATQRWSGNVGSEAHGVPKLSPVGMDDYIPDDPDTAGDEMRNPAYAMIEPQVASDHANYKGDGVRSEQFSYKAGLVFKVERDASEPSGYKLSAYNYQRQSQLDPRSAPKVNNDGTLKTQDLQLDKVEAKVGQAIMTVHPYAEDGSGNPSSGFYDKRQQQALDVIELDIGVLAGIINNGESNTGKNDPWNGKYKLNPGKAIDWNGVVYVEMPYDDAASSREDKVMPGYRNVALRLVNGSEVPSPNFSKKTGYEKGFTLATNGQLYVKGDFNADGKSSTGSSTGTDDGLTTGSSEAPVALVADAVTILSENFDDTKSKKSTGYRPATFTEVSAALVTGLLPTLPGETQISGGAHNLPRFLESWSGKEFRYRGSLVVLYESEVATAPMRTSFNWYNPPVRNWGYNDLFAAGLYPPGTPNARDFKRTDYKTLSASEYVLALADLDGFDPATDLRGHGGSGGGGSSGSGHSYDSPSDTGDDSDSDTDTGDDSDADAAALAEAKAKEEAEAAAAAEEQAAAEAEAKAKADEKAALEAKAKAADVKAEAAESKANASKAAAQASASTAQDSAATAQTSAAQAQASKQAADAARANATETQNAYNDAKDTYNAANALYKKDKKNKANKAAKNEAKSVRDDAKSVRNDARDAENDAVDQSNADKSKAASDQTKAASDQSKATSDQSKADSDQAAADAAWAASDLAWSAVQ